MNKNKMNGKLYNALVLCIAILSGVYTNVNANEANEVLDIDLSLDSETEKQPDLSYKERADLAGNFIANYFQNISRQLPVGLHCYVIDGASVDESAYAEAFVFKNRDDEITGVVLSYLNIHSIPKVKKDRDGEWLLSEDQLKIIEETINDIFWDLDLGEPRVSYFEPLEMIKVTFPSNPEELGSKPWEQAISSESSETTEWKPRGTTSNLDVNYRGEKPSRIATVINSVVRVYQMSAGKYPKGI